MSFAPVFLLHLNNPALKMPPIHIKICGVTTAEDARFAAEAGADAIGLNFYPQSPRYLAPQQAVKVLRAVPPFTSSIGVFVEMRLRQACAVSYQLGLRGIQTYDDYSPGEDSFPFAYIPAFRVKDADDLGHIRRYVEQATTLGRRPDAVLVDSRVDGQMGGTGQVAPWSILASFDPGVPVILAGGLTPENVAEAITIVRPWGVDVASGVESSPGKKDRARISQFIGAVRAHSVIVSPS